MKNIKRTGLKTCKEIAPNLYVFNANYLFNLLIEKETTDNKTVKDLISYIDDMDFLLSLYMRKSAQKNVSFIYIDIHRFSHYFYIETKAGVLKKVNTLLF